MNDREPEYLNPAKNRWRIDKWAAIKRFATVRCKRRAKDTLVLYLAGPDDLDRAVATRMGFRSSNLIAVNGDEGICNGIRRRGHPVMCGRFERIVATIPADFDIGVIDADLCCGLDRTIFQLHDETALRLLGRELVLSFNLQRGRDAVSNEIRARFEEANKEDLPDLTKHRGLQLWILWHKFLGTFFDLKNIDQPWFTSYKSNRVTMDSIVFPWDWQADESVWNNASNTHQKVAKMLRQRENDYPEERRLWAARRAVMTRQRR